MLPLRFFTTFVHHCQCFSFVFMNKVIISGGGTGGHIYPAIAVANELKARYPNIEILFVGAQGRMEMQKVPAAGYAIKGLPIAGLQRSLSPQNLLIPFKILRSLREALAILKDFRPDAVVGFGGYASAPVLWAATWLKIPTLIQEQNSYAGLTNKLLARRVQKICVAYPQMERFFPKEKIVYTGNPVRSDILDIAHKKEEALQHFGLSANHQTVLVIGGSLGARSINEAIAGGLEQLLVQNIQVLWQTGKGFIAQAQKLQAEKNSPLLKVTDFIQRMDLAYSAADVVVSRAGALSIAELCLVQKPIILVPSPNVAEDHQNKNAQALVQEKAALLVADRYAEYFLASDVLRLLKDASLQKEMSARLQKFAKPFATQDIAQHIIELTKKKF